MGMQVMAGRDFYPSGTSDSGSLVINESFAKTIAKKPEDAVGMVIQRNNEKFNVIGVIKTFIYNNVYGTTAPLVIFNDTRAENTSTLNVRFKSGTDYKLALAKAEAVIKSSNPSYPFEYKFVDEEFEKLFKGEALIGTLAAVFAGLAVFISCLGLFGLAAYTAERRIRENGIRKVLGASVVNIVQLLSREIIVLVIIANLIAWPIAWYFMNEWLDTFAYKIGINIWLYILAAFAAIFIALITVSSQTIKAAMSNPANTLRYE